MAIEQSKQMFTLKVETERFNRSLKSFIRKSNLDSKIVLMRYAHDLLKKIMEHNPVLHGRSRAAWYPSMKGLGVQFDLEQKVEAPSETSKGRTEGEFKLLPAGPMVWIELINACPYVIYLEYGHSAKAPHGMVRISMREMTGRKLPANMSQRYRKLWNQFHF